MATIERHEDIQGWQRARELTKFVYTITKQEAFARDFSLKSEGPDSPSGRLSHVQYR